MTSFVRNHAYGIRAVALSAIAGCALVTDPDASTNAWVEVDPTPIRTIHYDTQNGEPHDPPSEVTSKHKDDIECLHTTPRTCWLRETIGVTVHNTGSTTLLLDRGCDFPLERHGKGEWHKVYGGPCLAVLRPPIEIAPGETYPTNHDERMDISIRGMPRGEYRVRLRLTDEEWELLPHEMRTSEPFAFKPLPDFEPWVCPTESRVELAQQYAREELEKAASGKSERGAESAILRLESEVPGIGGFYYDPDEHYWVIWVTDASSHEAAAAALREYLDERAGSNQGVNWQGSIKVRTGDYAFSELVGWNRVLFGFLIRIPGWTSLDADEGLNRVHIGVANPWAKDDAECVVTGIGVPPGMAQVEEEW